MPKLKLEAVNLLTKDEILENKTPVTKLRGIYFLIRDNEIVYVGQSTNILGRVYHHTRKKIFDGFSCLECKEGDMNLIEAEYILRLDPIYNRQLPKNNKYKSLDVLLGLIGGWSKRKKLQGFIERNQIKPIYNRYCNYYHIKDFESLLKD